MSPAETEEFKEGDKVYMPALGDTVDKWMIYLSCHGEGYTKMARLKYPKSGYVTKYPYRFVVKVHE